jgi:predicted glycoside hydrolase/deacetylase ChbG (UPF0249 family)
MKKRKVIITADDFGLVPEINDAVLAGYDNGVITSAAMRVNSTASGSAAVSAALRPGLGIGLQLVLCDGQSTLPRRHIPNLVDSSGRFISEPLEAAWLYRNGGGYVDELRAEIRAQIERFLATGLMLTFISGHFQFHLHPTVIRIIRELAPDYPIPALRKPCSVLAKAEARPGIPGYQSFFETQVLSLLVRRGKVGTKEFLGPDRVERLAPLRPSTESGVVARLQKLGSGVTELVCHPGSLLPRYDGMGEEAVVSSPRVAQALVDSGVEPISYMDLIEDS